MSKTDDFTKPMSLVERLRAARIIIASPYVARIDLSWLRQDGVRASRIWVGRS